MEREWYYRAYGRECGPVPFERLAELVRHRRLWSADEVRRGASAPWRRVDEYEEFSPLLRQISRGVVDPSSASGGATRREARLSDEAGATSERHGMHDWYCQTGDAVQGPFRAHELQQMVADGRLIPLDLVRPGTTGPWREYFRWDKQIEIEIERAAALKPAPKPGLLPSAGSSPRGDDSSSAPASDAPREKASADSANDSADSVSHSVSESARRVPSPAVDPAAAAPRRVPRPASIQSAGRASYRELLREHWFVPTALLLLVVVNVVLGILAQPDVLNQERHKALSDVYQRMERLRNDRAAPEAWDEFVRDARHELEPLLARLEKEADVHHPIEQHLLWAGRDYLLPLIEQQRMVAADPNRRRGEVDRDTAANEGRFQTHMDEAKRLFYDER